MTRPPPDALAWVEQSVGRGSRVVGTRRLTGGLTSTVHLVTALRRGRRTAYVLRRWEADQLAYGARALPLETRILTALESSEIPAPRLIATTTEAAHGGPAVLMTRVPGRVYLMPRDRERWLAQMARMLARIHATGVDAKPFESWIDPAQLSPPSDALRPEIWRDAIALVHGAHAPNRRCFIHRDYQHFNLLWSRERLTGVVDWVESCIGPPEIDVGHCRLNLAILFSAEIADRFRELYEIETGRRVDARWDVHALLSYGPEWKTFLPYQIDGRAPFDPTRAANRVEDVLVRALGRV